MLANFVIAHFTKHKTALFELKRVLHPGGRLGFTAWADAEDDLARTWFELVQSVVPREVVQAAMDERLPWRERFRQRLPLEEALMEAGIRQVRTEVRRYRFQYSLDEYVEGMGTWATGRFVRSMLGESGFAAFLGRARAVFGELRRPGERFPRGPVRDRDQTLGRTRRQDVRPPSAFEST